MVTMAMQTMLRKIPAVALAIAGLTVMLLSQLGLFPTSHTSILCDDPAIRRLYTTDTIPSTVLLAMSSVGPFITVLIVEWVFPSNADSGFKQALRIAWTILKDVFFGQLIAMVMAEFLKISISEARPHFMQTCKPDLPPELCAQGYIELDWHNCSNPQGLRHPYVLDSMKSFPSGHSSLGAFIGVYMTWYLLARLRGPWLQGLAVCLSSLWLLWGGVCGVSRIWDNRHHWWDVAVGAAFGVVAAHATIRYLTKDLPTFPRRRSKGASSYHEPADDLQQPTEDEQRGIIASSL